MDLRGKPSTFSAEGTVKPVVGEDGLDGGSLVFSMMDRYTDTGGYDSAARRAPGTQLCSFCESRMEGEIGEKYVLKREE